MNMDKIPIGVNPPHDFNVIIEIPRGGFPVKYEMDKESGAMFVDRFLNTSMTYPGNYGFIPHTLAADGDPCDVLVLGPSPVVPGAVIRVRPIGALVMTDEAGCDDKIIAVPVNRLNPYYAEMLSYLDLPQVLRDQVAHFFQHYKDLEKGKWVAGLRWVDMKEALRLIENGIKAAQNYKPGTAACRMDEASKPFKPKPAKKAAAKTAPVKSAKKKAEAAAAKPAKKKAEAVAAKPAKKTAEAAPAKPVKKTAEAAAAKPAKKTAEAAAAKPAKKTAEAAAARPAKKTAAPAKKIAAKAAPKAKAKTKK